MFSPNMLVQYMHTTGDTVIVRIVGPSPHRDEFQHIIYMRAVGEGYRVKSRARGANNASHRTFTLCPFMV